MSHTNEPRDLLLPIIGSTGAEELSQVGFPTPQTLHDPEHL
jgi:hypothetical protein